MSGEPVEERVDPDPDDQEADPTGSSTPRRSEVILARIDAWQRRVAPAAFVVAVGRKFTDDRGRQFAALISFYSFFSLFPLLFVLVTVVGVVLDGRPKLQQDLLDSAFGRFPFLGDEIAASVNRPSGSMVAIAVGVGVALFAGLAATVVAQDAVNATFDVPVLDRGSFLVRRLRGLATLAVFGTAIVATTVLGAISRLFDLGGPLGVAMALVVSALLNGLLAVALIQALAHQPLRWSGLKWAAVFCGIGWAALQAIGSLYVQRVVASASRTYGVFAIVIGLLSWVLIQARIFLYGAEVASVVDRRLWPRSLVRADPTSADRAAAALIERREQRLRS